MKIFVVFFVFLAIFAIFAGKYYRNKKTETTRNFSSLFFLQKDKKSRVIATDLQSDIIKVGSVLLRTTSEVLKIQEREILKDKILKTQ